MENPKVETEISQSIEEQLALTLADENLNAVFEEKRDVSNSKNKYWTIRITKKYKISIRKALIPLRLALFCWYGAARIPLAYLSVFTKQRGLSLVEFASPFSVTFVIQFLSAFFSGIVADKIGNCKPVLLFHVLFTLCVILSLIFAPRLTDCPEICSGNQSTNSTGKIDGSSELTHFVNVSSFLEQGGLFVSNTTKTLENSPSSLEMPKGNCTHFAVSKTDCKGNKNKFIYVALILLFFTSFSSVYRFLDITVMAMAKLHDSYYGFERCFAISGDVFLTFLSGVLMNLCSPTDGENDYAIVFWLSASMMTCVSICILFVRTPIPQGQKLWRKTFRLAKNLDFIVFASLLLVMGTSTSFHDSYLLLFLEHLKASRIIFGLQPALHSLYGLPFLWTSSWWQKVFGPQKLFVAALLGHAMRGGSYSLIDSSWYVILIETASILVYHLLWVSVVQYSHKIAPVGLTATVVASTGAIHYGIGRSSGVFFGGLLMSSYGYRSTFRVIAGLCLTTAILYSLFLYCRRPTISVNNKNENTETPKTTY